MAVNVKVFLWESFNLHTIRPHKDFSIILPVVQKLFETGVIASICLLHKGIWKEICKAKVKRCRQAPLGRVMETEWATHIGPRDKEDYIEKIRRCGRHLDDYNYVMILIFRTERIYEEILSPIENSR